MTKLFARPDHPQAGYKGDSQRASELNSETFYEVESVDMGQSHTTIILKDFDIFYNSVNFEFFVEDEVGDKIPHDIYSDSEYNQYLKRIR